MNIPDPEPRHDYVVREFQGTDLEGSSNKEPWYVGSLQFQLYFGELPPDQKIYFSAAVNGKTFAQIVIIRRGTEDNPIVYWNTLGLVDGRRSYYTNGPSTKSVFHNILQLDSVKPGTNVLTVKVSDPIDQIDIFSGTSVWRIESGPPKLFLNAISNTDHVEMNKPLDVTVRVSNDSEIPARDVQLSLVGDESVKIAGAAKRSLGQVDGQAEVEFQLRFTRPGEHTVNIYANSQNAGSEALQITGDVTKDGAAGWLEMFEIIPWRIAVFVAVVIVAALIVRPRPSARKEHSSPEGHAGE